MSRRIDCLVVAGVLVFALGWSAALARAAEEPVILDVWPGKVPGETAGQVGPERDQTPSPQVAGRPIRLLTDVSKPTISVYRPAKDKDTGAAVVICPGGGYHILAWDLEGTEVAEWLNSIGVTGIILKYRVPARPGKPRHEPPLQDAQRAVSLVRSKAGEWGIDPKRIGILGFSAGGNLAAMACTHADKRTYEPADQIDQVSCRPDFAVLVYPAWLNEGSEKPPEQKAGEGAGEAAAAVDPLRLRPEFPVGADTPPMFMAHAGDDPIAPEASIAMYVALRRAGVAAEMHVYTAGGHGFGLRPTDHPSSAWPQQCETWMRSRGLLGDQKAEKAKP